MKFIHTEYCTWLTSSSKWRDLVSTGKSKIHIQWKNQWFLFSEV